MTVTIIDNSIEIIQRISEQLMGNQVIKNIFHALSYDEAIDLLHQHEHDIFLMDLDIRSNKAVKLLKEIKKKQKQTIVIVLVNQSEKHIADAFKLYGADYVIDKYHEFDQIPELMNTLAQNKTNPGQ